jgi:hypothetical protein
MKHYTYLHRRADTNKVFYIGKGQNRRAWTKRGRNKFWNSIVKGCKGFNVEIIARWDTEEQALDHEIFLIWCFKQISTKLVNQTTGGEGTRGKKQLFVPKKKGPMSEEHKQRIREGCRKRWEDPEHRKNQNRSRTGRPSWNKGMSLSEEQKQRITEGNRNKKISDERRLQISNQFKGRTPWNKGLKYSLKDKNEYCEE